MYSERSFAHRSDGLSDGHKDCTCDGNTLDCECLMSATDDDYDHASYSSEQWDGEQFEESERSYKEDYI